MSKGILVVDMPESCSNCKFLYEFQGMKKCNLMNVLNSGNSRLSQSNFTKCRHEKCPLVELPEMDGLKAAATANSCLHLVEYARGWNDFKGMLER